MTQDMELFETGPRIYLRKVQRRIFLGEHLKRTLLQKAHGHYFILLYQILTPQWRWEVSVWLPEAQTCVV